MYLGFLSLYLLTSDLSIFSKNINTQWASRYTVETRPVVIDDLSKYCKEKVCVVKCCKASDLLDYGDICDSSAKHEYLNDTNDPTIDEEITSKHLNQTSKIDAAFRLIIAQDGRTTDIHYIPSEFNILKDGGVKFKVTNPTERWIEAPPLGYCIDCLSYIRDKQNNYPLVFKLARDHHGQQENKQDIDQLKFVGAGLLLSLFLVLVLVFRIEPQVRRTIAPIVIALTCTVLVGYILKIVQLYALGDGSAFGTCTTFNAAYYFFVLSSFFWETILIFDLWWRTWSFRKDNRDFHHKHMVRFLLYCACGWGVPILMTIATVIFAMSDLNNTLPSQRQPYENCFSNGMQSMLHLHIPIVILTITYCVLFSMLIHNIVLLKRTVYNASQYKTLGSAKVITTKHKVVIWIKLIVGIAVICLFALIPGLSLLPYVALIVSSIYIWMIFYFTFVFTKSVFVKVMIKRFKSSHYVSGKFEASMILKDTANNITDGTLFEGLEKGDDTEKIVDKNDNIDI